jgi:flavin-binding protein dodecin
LWNAVPDSAGAVLAAIWKRPYVPSSALKRVSQDHSSGAKNMAIAKITEIQAASKKSFEDAIKAGIARADKTLRNLTGAWVKEQKVKIEKGKIIEYRVIMKVTFVLTD